MKPKTLTEKQAAELIGCSKATLYRLRRDRKIHHYRKIGRLIKYKPEDIDAILEELKVGRPKPIEVNSVARARFG